MKKISMLFFSLLIMILITGCGAEEKEGQTDKEPVEPEKKEQTLVCTTTENDEDIGIEQVISMTYKEDKLKHMTMEVNTQINNSDVKENWEAYKKVMDEQNEEFDKDGVSLKVVVDDQNYKYNVILDIDVENATEEALKEQGFEGIKEDTSTLEESKKSAEADGATCVIK